MTIAVIGFCNDLLVVADDVLLRPQRIVPSGPQQQLATSSTMPWAAKPDCAADLAAAPDQE
jgi:hypothetical protein